MSLVPGFGASLSFARLLPLPFLTEPAEQLKKLITKHHMKYQKIFSGFQKGGVPAAPSGTATLLRLSPSHRLYPKTGYDPAL